jgi:hypothetical protein
MIGQAEYLLNDDLLKQIFAQIERDALETAISAKPGDDETRRNAIGDVRAIRSVRWQLEAILKAKTKPAPGAVA